MSRRRSGAEAPRDDRVAVVVPAYNEAATIGDLATRILASWRTLIVVDDGSTDATGSCLSGLDVVLIRHDLNLGKGAALWRGMQAALELGADAIVTLDGDGQHRPEDIQALVDCAREWPSTIVIGARDDRRRHMPFGRYLANSTADFWISWAAGYRIQDTQSGFRVYPATLLRQIALQTGKGRGFVFESEILIEAAGHGVRSWSVSIPTIYSSSLRPSHFRPVADIAGIAAMVAKRLISRGFYPRGLYRSFVLPRILRKTPPA